MAVVLAWLNARVVDPVLQVIQRSAEPKQLAFSAALGLTIGIFPICGTTVIIGGIAVAMLGARCNAVTLMVLNLAATPLELSLIIPFLRLGEALTGSANFLLTSDAFKTVITCPCLKGYGQEILDLLLAETQPQQICSQNTPPEAYFGHGTFFVPRRVFMFIFLHHLLGPDVLPAWNFVYPTVHLDFTPLVYHALILGYMCQAAYLIQPIVFYVSVPAIVRRLVLVLAILESLVGSQLIISWAFSIINLSQSARCFPLVKVVHTSEMQPPTSGRLFGGRTCTSLFTYRCLSCCLVLPWAALC